MTTPIYYVNDRPHIGHAYTSIAADALARWRRLQGQDCMLLTGTDEHGQKIAQAAEKAGIPTDVFVAQNAQQFRDLAALFGVSHDDFIRTTESRHKVAVKALWEKLVEKGHIYLGSYDGWYAIRDEAFYAEADTIIVDGKRVAKSSGAEVEWVTEPSYFFKLSAFRNFLLDYLSQPNRVLPLTRRNEVLAMLDDLQDLSISRLSVSWGIPVPNDPAHTVYVWLDALTNYISALGYPGEDWQRDRYENAVHLVGKDIVKFHAVFWPAFLRAAGLPLPKTVFAHGWWTNEGHKISKSLGNTIDPVALVQEFGIDAVRYYLLRETPFGEDGDFRRDRLIQRADSELANELGNLLHRVLTLIHRYDYGCLAGYPPDWEDHELLDNLHSLPARVGVMVDALSFDDALAEIWASVRHCNQWISGSKPWAMTDPVGRSAVLRALHEALRTIATVLIPFIPNGAHTMLTLLGVPERERTIEGIERFPLPVGVVLPTPVPVFRRFGMMKAA